MSISGPQFSPLSKVPLSKIEPKTLEDYLKKSTYKGGPIQMLVDEFNSGTQVILLSDPHPACDTPEYAEFLKKLYLELARKTNLKVVMLETTKKNLESLPSAIKTWKNSGIQNYSEYSKHIESKYKDINEMKKAGFLLWGEAPVPWDDSDEEANLEAEKDKIACEELNSLNFRYWLPMLEKAYSDKKLIVGFDTRQDIFSGESLTQFMSEKVKGTNGTYKLDLDEYIKEKDKNIVSGGSVDFDFYQNICDELVELDPQEKVLIIAGTDHVTKTQGLNRLGHFLFKKPELTMKTVLVEVGWWDELAEENTEEFVIRARGMHFNSLMKDIKLGYVAIDNNGENTELSSIQVFESEKVSVGLFDKPDKNIPTVPVLVGDFDKLIYFNSKQDLEQYLRSN